MAKAFRNTKLDDRILTDIEEHRKKLRSIGVPDVLLSNTKVLRFMSEKARRNTKSINFTEIIRLLQG